jgi:omega-amidase
MSLLAKAPVFKPFNIALIQLGGLGANKSANLSHAREMILKAASPECSKPKPHIIVLPVCR